MSLLSVWVLELSLYTHGPLLRTMKFQLSVTPHKVSSLGMENFWNGVKLGTI